MKINLKNGRKFILSHVKKNKLGGLIGLVEYDSFNLLTEIIGDTIEGKK